MHGVQSATHPHMQQFAIPEDHVLHLCAAFVMAHMDVSDIQLPIVMRGLFGVDFTSSTLKRHVVAVCKFVHDDPALLIQQFKAIQ